MNKISAANLHHDPVVIDMGYMVDGILLIFCRGHPVNPVLGEQIHPGIQIGSVQQIGLSVEEFLDTFPVHVFSTLLKIDPSI
jgi:hypothetical protein